MKIYLTWILFFATIFCYPLSGQNNISSQYIFNAITINEGLPINYVDDIFKDSKGFLWISSQGGGLSRYDGYEFVTFNASSSSASLKSNFIRQTCEDNHGRLWIASDHGVDIISLATMQSVNLASSDKLYGKLLVTPVSHIIKDRQGNVWIMGNKDIYKLVFDPQGNISDIEHLSSGENNFSTISEIEGEIWAGLGASICQLVLNQSGQLMSLPLTGIFEANPNIYISSILKKDEILWIGTDYGLHKYDCADKTTNIYVHDANNPQSISQNMITSLAFLNDSVLSVGTLRGINLHNIKTSTFERIFHNNGTASLTSDFVNSLLPDGNSFWIGTEAGGINKMTLRKLAIHNYVYNEKDPASITPNPVNAIFEDHKGDLWIGTVEGGLNRKIKGKTGFTHYTVANSSISHNSVSALEEDCNGNLWIGTWGGGVSVLNLNTPSQVTHKDFIAGMDYIGMLKYDPVNKGMWIGTNRNIFYYDEQTNNIVYPLPENMTRNIMGVLGCLIDNNDILWVGCSKGMLRIDLHSFEKTDFKCPASFFTMDKSKTDSLFLKNVTCLHQGKDNAIWIGSNGYGIRKIVSDGDKELYESFTTDQGLVSNTVLGIIEDKNGMIWISTGRGISSYSPQTRRFVNYTKKDGLVNEQFYWNAAYKSPTTDNIYFGNMGGLTELQGKDYYASSDKIKAVFTKLLVLNQPILRSGNKDINKDISYADRFDLHEKDKSFTIEFSALDYDNPSTVSYSYRLLGFEKEWVDVPSGRRFASYTNLRPGTYTLQVRCASKGYDWSEDITELRIEVHPYFYKTGWFIGLCLLLLAFLIVRFYKWRIGTLTKQRAILHKKVEERTSELEERKKLLEEQAYELKSQNEKLIEQNEKISSQRKKLIELSTQVQEAMTDKISFFTNITHEFRTPITLIVGPIERALKLSTNPKVIEQLQFVSRNSKHLLSLVNQLMDFRKIESENMDISPVTDNFLHYMDEMLVPFESYALERGIVIRKIYRLQPSQILFDKEAMRKIVTNLLSNAIKFTPDNGTISVYVGSFTETNTDKKKLYINVSDSGSGVKEEDLNRIFERFYQSKGNIRYAVSGQSGTGIGLYLCKKMVELLDGNISVKNKKTNGASFRIILPLRQEEILPDNAPEKSEILSPKKNSAGNDETTGDSKKTLTILVVEDNTDMRKYICSILTDYYKVKEAENGAEALTILKAEDIDFIISDLMMPVMDGLELSQRVKSDFAISHIPFLMLTAKSSVETQISSYKTGADEFLAKPFDEELLLARIRNILDTRNIYLRRFSLQMDVKELNIADESADEKFLHKAMEIIKENYKNAEYEVSDFIVDMGMSKSLLNKKMQILTGYSTGHFIRNFRLNTAREIILKTKGDKNISEIAFEVGFNDPKYFTRCFTKNFGTPPSSVTKND